MSEGTELPAYEWDEATGLPVLPTGYYWKVKISEDDYTSVLSARVSIKQRNFWRTEEAFTVVRLGYLDPRDKEAGRDRQDRHYDIVKAPVEDFPNLIAQAAESTMDKKARYFSSNLYRDAALAAAKNLNGNYPPKKLPS